MWIPQTQKWSSTQGPSRWVWNSCSPQPLPARDLEQQSGESRPAPRSQLLWWPGRTSPRLQASQNAISLPSFPGVRPAHLLMSPPTDMLVLKLNSLASQKVKVSQSLWDPHGLYTVHGILQVRILEWVAFPFSRGSSQLRSPALQADSLPAEPQAGVWQNPFYLIFLEFLKSIFNLQLIESVGTPTKRRQAAKNNIYLCLDWLGFRVCVYFFIYNFCLWQCWAFIAGFSQVTSRDYSLVAMHRLLIVVASLVRERGL